MTKVLTMPKSPKQMCRERAEQLLKQHKNAFADHVEAGGADVLKEYNRLDKSYKHGIKVLQRQYPDVVHAGMYYAFSESTYHLVKDLIWAAAWHSLRKWLLMLGVTVFILSLAAVLWIWF